MPLISTDVFQPNGFLQDAVTGAPVIGATVTAYPSADVNPTTGALGSTTTDVNGKFTIASIPVQQIDLKIDNSSQIYWWKGNQNMSYGTGYFNRIMINTASSAGVSNVPVKLYESIISAGVDTSIAFAAIPGLWKGMQLKGAVMFSAATSSSINLTLNADTDGASNYTQSFSLTSGTSSIVPGNLGAVSTNSTSGSGARVDLDFWNYADTNTYKTFISNIFDATTRGFSAAYFSWNNKAPITDMKIYLTGGAKFGTGTYLALYGIP